MSLEPSSTLRDRFHGARTVLDVAIPRQRRVGRTYQGFIKALMSTGKTLHARMQAHLRCCIGKIAGQHWTRFGWVMFAVDGTKIHCVRSRANERSFGTGGKANSHPHQLLTTLWHMGTGLPWAWVSGRADASERHQLREMIGLLPKDALLVADAGFTGYDLLREIQDAGVFFLLRVGSNVRLLQELGFAQCEDGDTVYLWPDQRRRTPPLVLRLVKVQTPGHREPMYLVTSVLDRDRLDDETAATIYRMRWGIEVFHRSLKQTLERRKMRSAAPKQAELELHWSLIALLLMGLLSVMGIIARGCDPLSWSVAGSLRETRQTLRSPTVTTRTFMSRIGKAVKDRYERKSQKKARDWPHKKNDPLPKPPKIRKALPTETQLAQRLAIAK